MKIENLKIEFDQLKEIFPSLCKQASTVETKELYSIHDLYEIEPFFMEIKNQIPAEVSFINDVEGSIDDIQNLYMYHVKMDIRKIFFKKLMISKKSSYETVYEYNKDYFKSATVHNEQGVLRPISLAYLFFKDHIPYKYLEVNEHGVNTKDYHHQDNVIIGYKQSFTSFSNVVKHTSDVKFYYDEKPEICKIDQTFTNGSLHVLYKKFPSNEEIDNVLKRVEDYLVQEISYQIADNVKINESVYTILLEYCPKTIFPPTLSIGLEQERKNSSLSLAEACITLDMHYFSEKDEDAPGYIKVDLYDPNIQELYLFVEKKNRDSGRNDDFNKIIYSTYINIAKRLMEYDFSKSFPISKDFLVMVRDVESNNAEDFYSELKKYAKK